MKETCKNCGLTKNQVEFGDGEMPDVVCHVVGGLHDFGENLKAKAIEGAKKAVREFPGVFERLAEKPARCECHNCHHQGRTCLKPSSETKGMRNVCEVDSCEHCKPAEGKCCDKCLSFGFSTEASGFIRCLDPSCPNCHSPPPLPTGEWGQTINGEEVRLYTRKEFEKEIAEAEQGGYEKGKTDGYATGLQVGKTDAKIAEQRALYEVIHWIEAHGIQLPTRKLIPQEIEAVCFAIKNRAQRFENKIKGT